MLFSLFFLFYLGLTTPNIIATLSHPPTENANRTFDPINDPSHGRIVSPSRAVLWLDCPECPMPPDIPWEAPAIIYDFTINTTTAPPTVFLYDLPFYPSGPNLGFTPLTEQRAQPVPYTFTLDAYLTGSSPFNTVAIVGAVVDELVPNRFNLSIIRVYLLAIAGPGFENRWGNVSAAGLYVLDEEGKRSIEWWEITPMALWGSENRTEEDPVPGLPKGLEDKLSRREISGRRIKVGAGWMAGIGVGVLGICGLGLVGIGLWMKLGHKDGYIRLPMAEAGGSRSR